MDDIRRRHLQKPKEIIHSGISYNPPKKEHENLLNMLAQDEIRKITKQNKFISKPSEVVPNNTEKPCDEELEEMVDEEVVDKVPSKKANPVTTKKRRQRMAKLKLEISRQKQKLKEKGEAHGLRNLPKFCKEIKKTDKENKERNTRQKELVEKKKADKEFMEQIENVPFQLPSELPGNLRSIQPEGDLLQELCAKFKVHKPQSVKPKRQRKFKRMIKKKGLV